MRKIYFSVDIETDGLVAGRNNMLSLGAAALDMGSGEIVDTFKMNLSTVPSMMPDPDTMEWWKHFPDAYIAARVDSRLPSEVLKMFVAWVVKNATEGSVIFAWKPILDLAFLRFYLHAFHPQGAQLCTYGIFARQGFGLDQKTVVALALKQAYRKTKMDTIPNCLRLDSNAQIIKPHSHDALEDAVEQAHIFYNAVRILGVEL